jgi:hypothetical protein
VSISNVQFDYVGAAAPTSANGIATNAWTDVTISNCQFFGGFTRAINPSPSGSFDSTLRRMLVSDCYVKGAKQGFAISSGVLATVLLTDNRFFTTGEAVTTLSSVTGARLEIDGGTYETTGAATPAVLVSGNVTEVSVRRADIRAVTYAARFNNGGGEIANCRIASAEDEAIRVSGGAWIQADNDIVVLTTKSAFIRTAGTLVSVGNRRGTNTTAPTLAAKVGEIVRHSAPAASGNVGWVATAAGNPATWNAYGAIAA